MLGFEAEIEYTKCEEKYDRIVDEKTIKTFRMAFYIQLVWLRKVVRLVKHVSCLDESTPVNPTHSNKASIKWSAR